MSAGRISMSSSGKRAAARKYGYVLWAAVGSITAFAAVGALVIMLTGWPENALLVPGLLLFFLVVLSLDRGGTSPGGVHFLLAAAVMGFCAVITDVLMAQVEVANPGTVPTLIAAGLQLALGMLTAALMWPLMASRVGWLVEHFMQASVWRIVWVLPLAHMLLFIAMMPEDLPYDIGQPGTTAGRGYFGVSVGVDGVSHRAVLPNCALDNGQRGAAGGKPLSEHAI